MELSSRSSYPSPDCRRAPCSLLLLDADDDFRTALADALRDDGYQVIAAGAVTDIPPLGSLPPIDLAIVGDVTSNDAGLGFLSRLRSRQPGVPAVLMPAYLPRELEASVRRRDNVRLLGKPLDYDELYDLIHALRCAAS